MPIAVSAGIVQTEEQGSEVTVKFAIVIEPTGGIFVDKLHPARICTGTTSTMVGTRACAGTASPLPRIPNASPFASSRQPPAPEGASVGQ